MTEKKLTVTVDVKNLDFVKKVLDELHFLTSGWNGYCWKDGEYIDDVQEYFDGRKKEIMQQINEEKIDENPF